MNLTALVYGTAALPFCVGASFGFVGSILAHYKACLSRTLRAVSQHQQLILLHARYHFPTEVWNEDRMETFRERNSSWVDDSMMLVSWHSAGSALEVIFVLECFLYEWLTYFAGYIYAT